MGIERVVLEHHSDVPVFRGYIVHQLPINVQFSAGDLLQPRHHSQSGRLAATRGADQHDELLVRHIQVKFLNSHNPLIGHLELGLFLLAALVLLFGLLVIVRCGIDLLHIYQRQSCHLSRL